VTGETFWRHAPRVLLWVYWLALTGLLAYLVISKAGAVIGVDLKAADLAMVYALMALLGLPLVVELTFDKVTVKSGLTAAVRETQKKVEDAQGEIRQLGEVISDIRIQIGDIAQTQNQNVTQTTIFQIPGATQLQEAKSIVDAVVPRESTGGRERQKLPAFREVGLTGELTRLLSRELRRLLGSGRDSETPEGTVEAPEAMAATLVRLNVITPGIRTVIETILAINRTALYGGEITEDQLRYVDDVGQKLLTVLEATPPVDTPPKA
jgi:hypothetical protein